MERKKIADADKNKKRRSNGHPKRETEIYKEPDKKGPAKIFFFRIFLQVYCKSCFPVENNRIFSYCVYASLLPI